MKYPNDDRLINLCQRHNKKATDILVRRYAGFIRAWAREYLSRNALLDFDEICLIGDGSFLNAIKSYDYRKGNFYKYVLKVVYNSFYAYSKKQIKEIKSTDYYDEDDKAPFVGYCMREESNNAYNSFDQFYKAHEDLNYLSRDMRTILELKRLGKTYKEIAEIMNINYKRVDFLYQQSVKKIREFEASKNK